MVKKEKQSEISGDEQTANKIEQQHRSFFTCKRIVLVLLFFFVVFQFIPKKPDPNAKIFTNVFKTGDRLSMKVYLSNSGVYRSEHLIWSLTNLTYNESDPRNYLSKEISIPRKSFNKLNYLFYEVYSYDWEIKYILNDTSFEPERPAQLQYYRGMIRTHKSLIYKH